MPLDTGDCPTVIHLERWRSGDDSAFEALHGRLTPLLRSRVRRHRAWPMLESHFQVDDVLQDFWARAVPAAKQRFEHVGPGSLLGFLGKIMDREVIDLARKHRAQKRGDGNVHALATNFDAPDRAGPCHAAPTTPTSNARISELVRMARDELSEREYEAWDLVEMQQFTAEEAGVAMRISGSAVRGLLLRSRAKLVARMSGGRPGP